MEHDGVVADDLDSLRPLLQHLLPGAAVMLVAPFHVLRRDGRAVVEFEAGAQLEGRALGILGKFDTCRRAPDDPTSVARKFLISAVVQGVDEIVGRRRAVMLLRVEPARGDVGVPRQRHLALRDDRVGGARTAARTVLAAPTRQRPHLRSKLRRVSAFPPCSPPVAVPPGLRLQLNLLPRIGVAGADKAREHVLPFRRFDARPDRVHEGVAEHRDEIVVFKDRALDVLGQLPCARPA